MFDADPTIDRASVELCTELFTDDVMVSVANEIIDRYELTLYRRHSSGIDRWYPHTVPVIARQEQPMADADPAPSPGVAESKVVVAEAEPKPDVPAAAAPPTVSAPTAAEAQRKNNLDGPPITQAVPITPRATSAVPPPPPITQVMPVTSQMPVTMPAPTTQVPVTAPPATSELDAAVIADEVAEAIKRAFAGMGSEF
jgi:hypothetical protein